MKDEKECRGMHPPKWYPDEGIFRCEDCLCALDTRRRAEESVGSAITRLLAEEEKTYTEDT